MNDILTTVLKCMSGICKGKGGTELLMCIIDPACSGDLLETTTDAVMPRGRLRASRTANA